MLDNWDIRALWGATFVNTKNHPIFKLAIDAFT